MLSLTVHVCSKIVQIILANFIINSKPNNNYFFAPILILPKHTSTEGRGGVSKRDENRKKREFFLNSCTISFSKHFNIVQVFLIKIALIKKTRD